MKSLYLSFFGLLSIGFVTIGACQPSSEIAQKQIISDSTKYKNPVFEPILADPSIVKSEDGWFYAYGTMDNWGDGKGVHKVPVLKSRDLVNWQFVKDAFLEKPNWKKEGGIWAPDVVRVKDQYFMYYSISTWGDPNPGIGLAIAARPDGSFTDHGKVFLSDEVNVPNSIDPFYFEENGHKYLFWGSYSNAPSQGTFAIELTADGTEIMNIKNKVKIAAGDFEGVMIHKRKDYYYFFGSKGSCCDGENSTYQVSVGRAKSLLGPYFDQEGREITSRGSGTLLMQRTSGYAGPGHNSRLFSDDSGKDWMLYHAIQVENPRVSSGANRRVLMLDQILWEDNWPEIKDASPSSSYQYKPTYNK